MPGMMRSRVSGRGTWCDCCSAWTATRAREKQAWQAEVDSELRDMGVFADYDYYELLHRLYGDGGYTGG